MTGSAPPRLSSWLLHHFAFGPQRESLIGDIVEQYQQGRSSTWYRRQALAMVFIGSVAFVGAHRRRTISALVLATSIPWFFATAGWLLRYGIPNHGWFTILLNIFVFGYCSAGVAALLLTITRSDDPASLTLVASKRAA